MSLPLAVKHLSKSYRNKVAVTNISFDIREGEIVGLLGANGAGKSTLIRSLLDLISVDSGEILIFGKPHQKSEARRGLAYLAEQFRPPHFATGDDVLKLLAGVEGVTFCPSKIAKYCDDLALDQAVLTKPCQSYSKGMRQKLGLIACLAANKPLLILDEPMSGLDPVARKLFKDRLLEQQSRGCSVLFSTHLLEDIQSVCSRVIIFDLGQLKFIGTLEELFTITDENHLEAAFLSVIEAV